MEFLNDLRLCSTSSVVVVKEWSQKHRSFSVESQQYLLSRVEHEQRPFQGGESAVSSGPASPIAGVAVPTSPKGLELQPYDAPTTVGVPVRGDDPRS